MGCLAVKYTRFGGITVSAERDGGISCSAFRIGGIDATSTRIGGMDADLTRVGGIKCRFSLICTTNIIAPYLEINPEIIWVYPDWSAYNDVISNTHWNVD